MARLWEVEYNYDNERYYLVSKVTGERRIVPPITEREERIKRYQQYYDKARVKCDYLNGETVYHTRVVRGKQYIYRMKGKLAEKE